MIEALIFSAYNGDRFLVPMFVYSTDPGTNTQLCYAATLRTFAQQWAMMHGIGCTGEVLVFDGKLLNVATGYIEVELGFSQSVIYIGGPSYERLTAIVNHTLEQGAITSHLLQQGSLLDATECGDVFGMGEEPVAAAAVPVPDAPTSAELDREFMRTFGFRYLGDNE